MHLRGIVQTAELEENPPGSDTIEMVLRLQGVGPAQPRRIVVPCAMLIENHDLEPEAIQGRAFEAEVALDDQQRWVVAQIAFAGRVLRPPE